MTELTSIVALVQAIGKSVTTVRSHLPLELPRKFYSLSRIRIKILCIQLIVKRRKSLKHTANVEMESLKDGIALQFPKLIDLLNQGIKTILW